MYISEETAQLILDAIAWCNRDWIEGEMTDEEQIELAREDFIRFCEVRGIEGVERKVKI